LLEKKYKNHIRKSKSGEIAKIADVFSYESTCRHDQGIFAPRSNKRHATIKVAAQSLDGLIESLQVNDHILTFQHHHEANQETSIGRAVLKEFTRMVTNFHARKHAELDNADATGKRTAVDVKDEPVVRKKMKRG
jgi:gamma-glutamyl-gamma-aminobutyrate hydrolase PuuD